MKATRELHDARPEPVARQHHARHARQRRRSQRYIDRVLGHRAHFEPVDLRQGDRVRRLRRRDPREGRRPGCGGEELFFELAIEDLQRAADLFLPIHERTDGVDGWSRSRCRPSSRTTRRPPCEPPRRCTRGPAGETCSSRSRAPPQGLPAIEECIAAGVPVNVTLLFSAAAVPGGRRRLHEGHRAPHRARPEPCGRVGRVGVHVAMGHGGAPTGFGPDLENHLGLAVGKETYRRLPGADGLGPMSSGSRTREPGCSDCCGPARERRTRTRPTRSTSRARRAVHRQHDARRDAGGLRRPRRGGRTAPRRWR